MSTNHSVRATWCIATETQDVHQVTMLKPIASTCNEQCPWRQANHGRTVELYYDHEVPGIPMPENFTFAPWKRADIWNNDLKHGVHGYGGLPRAPAGHGAHRAGDLECGFAPVHGRLVCSSENSCATCSAAAGPHPGGCSSCRQ